MEEAQRIPLASVLVNKEEEKDVENQDAILEARPHFTVVRCGKKAKVEGDCSPYELQEKEVRPTAAAPGTEAPDVKIKPGLTQVKKLLPDVLLPPSGQKELLESKELNCLGESSLFKLKRRLRLKLLVEEARNTHARRAELAPLEDNIAPPRIATRSTADISRIHGFTNDERPNTRGPSGKNRSSNTTPPIVYLSSESEDEDNVRITDPQLPSGGAYSDALQRLFGPLWSAVDPKEAPGDAATLNPPGPRKPGRPAKKISISDPLGAAAARKVPDSVSSLVKMLKKGGAELETGGPMRQTKCGKERKEAEEQDSALEYELERADNIRRNKEFLAQLGLSSTLNSMSVKKSNKGRAAGSKNAIREYERHQSIEHILLRNREILERRGSDKAGSLSNKKPRLVDSDDDDEERAIDGRSRSARLSKRMAKEKELLLGGELPLSTVARKLKNSSKGKEMDTNQPTGRRRTIPAAVIYGLTASNQQLIRFVSELIASTSSSLPQSHYDGNDWEQSPGHPDLAAMPGYEEDSPRLGGDAGRKRKDTWLTMIPFETPKTEYELERDQILRRHKDQFERLGIVSELIEEPQPPRPIRPYCRRWASEPDPAYQRNTRFQDRQRRSSMQPEVQGLKDNIALTGTKSVLEVHSVSCASSLVAKFTGGGKLDNGNFGENLAKSEVTDLEVMNFQAKNGTWLDPDLTRIYTMDLAAISGSSQRNALLAAGGSQGRIAVFAISDEDGSNEKNELRDTQSKTPLLSWTVDSSWVSQVLFLSNQFQENGTLLLSSYNDGRVVLWDINKQRVRSGTRGLSPLTSEDIPVVVCETSTVHTGGIFGMHEFQGKIATSSEGSVTISTIKQTGVVVERSITGHHYGIVRSVRFREHNILADCGVDTIIGILDLRASDPCTLKIQTAHKTGISMVEWSPGCADSNLVLSASNDPQLYLHDIRYPAKAMLQFEGHVHPRRVKCYSIYRPTFVAGGDAVVTPGEGTHQLSLYSVTTASLIRRLHIGYDPNILLWNNVIPKHGGVWAGCRGITRIQALWQQRGGLAQLVP